MLKDALQSLKNSKIKKHKQFEGPSIIIISLKHPSESKY
jgi:hypothetical protein